MHDNGDKPKTFIDCFTGGGKIGLSLPDGWCERIVMNDYDYGVFSYYKSCQSDYRKLLATVDGLVDKMTKQFFEGYNDNNPSNNMKAPKGVAYILAVKQ